VFDGESKKLKVKKDNSLGIIKGTVKTRDGQEFIANAEIRINSDTIIYSDANGSFKVVLPEDMQVSNPSRYFLHLRLKNSGMTGFSFRRVFCLYGLFYLFRQS